LRNEILAAGNDPRHIARVAAAVRMFNANAEAVGDAGARLTTFSDNVVFSKPFAPGDVEWLLQGLATTQLGLAVSGFWMRRGDGRPDPSRRAYRFRTRLEPRLRAREQGRDLSPDLDRRAHACCSAGPGLYRRRGFALPRPVQARFWDRIHA
jgi:hypothetical protein